MNKRKILLLAAALVMVAVLGIGGTLAYFTDDEHAKNTFTVGNVDIDLDEPKWEETGKVEAEDVYPGEALAKDPTITNVGANPCFVRVAVSGWDALINAGLSDCNIYYRTDYVDGKLGDNWVLHTDGYFYYTKILAKDEVTDALFDQIVMPTDLVNEDIELDPQPVYNLDVYAYAVQAQGAKPSWSAVEAMTVEEIAAWFATCGF